MGKGSPWDSSWLYSFCMSSGLLLYSAPLKLSVCWTDKSQGNVRLRDGVPVWLRPAACGSVVYMLREQALLCSSRASGEIQEELVGQVREQDIS